MSTELVPHQNIVADKVTDLAMYLTSMGPAASQFCGAGNPEAGQAILLTCLEEGMSLLEFRKTYHVIKGAPVMRATAMLANFRMNFGGNHRVVKSTSEEASLVLIDSEGNESRWKFTWKEAQQTRWPWKATRDRNGKEIPIGSRELKDNWSTPADRENMLWQRCVSKALQRVCPELVAGVAIEDSDYHPESNAAPAPPKKSAMDRVVNATVVSDDLPQAEETVQPPSDQSEVEATVEPEPEPGSQTEAEAMVSRAQLDRLQELREQLQPSSDKWEATMAKYGVSAPQSLTFVNAKDLIGRMEAAAAKKS